MPIEKFLKRGIPYPVAKRIEAKYAAKEGRAPSSTKTLPGEGVVKSRRIREGIAAGMVKKATPRTSTRWRRKPGPGVPKWKPLIRPEGRSARQRPYEPPGEKPGRARVARRRRVIESMGRTRTRSPHYRLEDEFVNIRRKQLGDLRISRLGQRTRAAAAEKARARAERSARAREGKPRFSARKMRMGQAIRRHRLKQGIRRLRLGGRMKLPAAAALMLMGRGREERR